MRRPLANKRPIGPVLDYSDSNGSAVYQSDEDVLKTAEAIVRRTPAEINRAEYQGYFSDPSIYIDFQIVSASPYTMTREYHSSSVSAKAQTGKMSEFSMRFPAISTEYISESSINEFIDSITPELYRVRVQRFELDENSYYHPHIHYSKQRRGEYGPKLDDEAPRINSIIKQWYSGIDDQVNI